MLYVLRLIQLHFVSKSLLVNHVIRSYALEVPFQRFKHSMYHDRKAKKRIPLVQTAMKSKKNIIILTDHNFDD